jgi:hypothetical protein
MLNIDWETRARERSKENKRAHKKIKEVTHSRDFWKQKYMSRDAEIKELNKKLSILKKTLEQIMDL